MWCQKNAGERIVKAHAGQGKRPGMQVQAASLRRKHRPGKRSNIWSIHCTKTAAQDLTKSVSHRSEKPYIPEMRDLKKMTNRGLSLGRHTASVIPISEGAMSVSAKEMPAIWLL